MTFRKLIIGKDTYQYFIGKRGGAIKFKLPDGSILLSDTSEVSGWSWNNIERGYWKGYFSITPRLIRNFLIKKLNLPEPLYEYCPPHFVKKMPSEDSEPHMELCETCGQSFLLIKIYDKGIFLGWRMPHHLKKVYRNQSSIYN